MKMSVQTLRPLMIEALRSGTVASVVMMPFGLFFKWLGLRVGHYGPKLADKDLEPAPFASIARGKRKPHDGCQTS